MYVDLIFKFIVERNNVIRKLILEFLNVLLISLAFQKLFPRFK